MSRKKMKKSDKKLVTVSFRLTKKEYYILKRTAMMWHMGSISSFMRSAISLFRSQIKIKKPDTQKDIRPDR